MVLEGIFSSQGCNKRRRKLDGQDKLGCALSVVCLLGARCADPDGGHRCLAAVSHAGRERRLPGAGYRHSAPVAGTQRHCAHPQTGALGTGTQTDADRSGGSDDRAGSHRGAGRLHRLPAAVLLPVPACLLWQARRRGRSQALRGSARPRDRLCAQFLLLPPPSMATPS